jgi:hypothetical protein
MGDTNMGARLLVTTPPCSLSLFFVLSRPPPLSHTPGVDTHIWGLDYSFLREAALRRQKQKTLFLIGGVDRDVTALDDPQYFSLMEPLPLGFLSATFFEETDDGVEGSSSSPSSRVERSEADLKRIINSMARALAEKMKATEPARFPESVDDLVSSLALHETSMRMVIHYRKVMEIQRRMYLDGKHSFTNSPNSLVRVQQYMSLLDAVMQEILNWSMGGSTEATAAGAAAVPSAAGAAGGGGGGGKGMGAGGKGMVPGSKGKAKTSGAKKGGGFG